jgi:hypothetical protein
MLYVHIPAMLVIRFKIFFHSLMLALSLDSFLCLSLSNIAAARRVPYQSYRLNFMRRGPLLATAAASRLGRALASPASVCRSASTCSINDCHFGTPSGIVNLGDTCYLASALQLLYRSDAYRNAVIRSTFKKGSVGSTLQDLFR